MRDVLVTGADGQLGRSLRAIVWPQGWRVVALDRAALDLTDTAAIAAAVAAGIEGRRWAAVINGAAYTAPDKAENEVVPAWRVNAIAPAAFAAACAESEIPLIHVSTDYVFAGNKDGPWEVNDPVAPLNVYGASKLGGELAVRTAAARHVIVRTSWVVSSSGHNFVRTMLRISAERDVLRVVDDQIGSPTSANDLAQALATITMRVVEDPLAPTGTFHFSNAGAVTWAGFAREIFRQSGLRGGPTATVENISTADYPTPARRPVNSLLSHAAISEAYGIAPRPWTEALGEILDDLIGDVT